MLNVSRTAALAVAVACAGSSAGAQPAPAPPTLVAPVEVIGRRALPPPVGPRLELYEERDLGGAGVILVAPAPNLLFRGFADRARSARAYGAWELCAAPDHRPPCAVVEGDVPFLGAHDLSERISSARPVPAR